MAFFKWLNLQLLADGGDGGGDGGGEAAGTPGGNTPDAGESRLRELGVPESVLAKRAKRASTASVGKPVAQQAAPKTEPPAQQAASAATSTPAEDGAHADTPARMSWEEIMADPEYNKQMQAVVQSRLRSAKGAEETLSKLAPAMELLSRRYGMDVNNLDADALAKAISDDDAYYEDRAIEMGVPVETAKKIDQNERDNARRQAEEARTIQEQKIQAHIESLKQQGEKMKETFPNFDLAAELQNPAFARMTSPNVNISVEDAYYAIHRKEIQSAAMQVTAQKTAQQMANAIRSGKSRPVENGTSAQAPSTMSIDWSKASREQREAKKREIREAAAHGRKIYPGQ